MPESLSLAPAPAPTRKTAEPVRAAGARNSAQRGLASPSAERTVALLVRETMPRIAAALAISGADREPALVVAASQLRHLMLEIENLAAGGADGWSHVAPELGCVVAAQRAVASALRGPVFDDIRRELMQARLAMLKALPADLATRTSEAKATPIAAVSASERVQLARHLLATCRERIAAASRRKGPVDETSAHALCRQLALDVASATDAALHITDRVDRTSLVSDVNALEERLDWLQSYLSQAPKLKWHRSIANVFDNADALRKVMGMMPKPRAYSGVIDPVVALERAEALAKGAAGKVPFGQSSDPQAAVGKILRGIDQVGAQRRSAIDDFAAAFRIHDPRPTPSWAQRVMTVAVDFALSVASAKLGELVASRLEKLLIARSTSRALSNEYLEHLMADEHWMRNVLVADALKQDAASRAAWTGRAKKSGEKLFDGGSKAAREYLNKVSDPAASIDLLDQYCLLSKQALAQGEHQVSGELEHLRGALEQADLEALNALDLFINGELFQAASKIQYDKTVRAWLDVEARDATRTHAGTAVDLYGPGRVPGALDVELLVGPEAHERPRLKRMRLNGHEPAARIHLREKAEPVCGANLNVRFATHYYWGFGGSREVVRSQDMSGRIHSLQTDPLERAVLRHRAAGQRMTSGSVHVAETYFLSEVSDARAEAAHQNDIKALSLTTRSIEEA